MLGKIRIHTIRQIKILGARNTIFIMMPAKNEIRIVDIHGPIGVIAIGAEIYIKRPPGHDFHQIRELREERLIEIIFPAKLQRI